MKTIGFKRMANCVTLPLMTAIQVGLLLLILRPIRAMDPKDGLNYDSEKVVRDAVYNNEAATASPKRDGHSVLVMPDALVKVYMANPDDVIKLLLTIEEGGRPKDSVLAAGYAMSLLGGPARGVVCVDNFEESKYDNVDVDWKSTPRKHWAKKVSLLMKDREAIQKKQSGVDEFGDRFDDLQK